MAVNVRFMMKHCFPSKPTPTGRGYSAIQSHHMHLKCSMKDVLRELSTTYKLMNPIRGIVPGSPYKTTDVTEQSDDDIDRQIEADNGEWQKQASKYVRERIFPESRYKLKKFVQDEQ